MSNDKAKKPMGPTDAVTPLFRASYLNAFEPRAADPKKPNEKNYGVEMWFRVKDTPESLAAGEKVVSIKALEDAAKAACTEAWGADASKWPKGFKHPFKVGEQNGGKNGPIPGVMIVRTNRKEAFGRPRVVDQNLKDIIDTKQVYSGCYMYGKVHAHCWKHPTGGQGVSFTLDMLQLSHDGEPLGNRMEAADAFEAVPLPSGSPAGAGAAAPSAPAEAGSVFGALG